MRATKLKSHPDGACSIRKKLGLTQNELAELLQVSRAAINLSERNQRSLPGPALLKISRLEIRLASTTVMRTELPSTHPAERAPESHCDEFAAALLTRKNRCLQAAAKLEEKLSATKELYRMTRLWLRLIEPAPQDQPIPLPYEDGWWKLQKQMAITRLKTCDAPVQAQLTAKIALLHGEAALIEGISREMGIC